MIVSITVTTELVASGWGDATSLVGILPAKAVPEIAHARAIAKTKRFIFVFSFEF
jgi:hypothetical protein